MKTYLISLTAAAMLAAVLRRLAPEGGAGWCVRLGAGLLVLLTALSPLGEADLVGAAERIAAESFYDPLTTEDFAAETNRQLSALISREAEAYILDKAGALGLSITVEVACSGESGVPAPSSAVMTGSWTEAEKARLTEIIAGDLGIPADRQEWRRM